LKRRIALLATGFVLASGVSVAAVGALSGEPAPTDRTQEIFGALGVDQRETTVLDLSGYTVRYVPHRNGDMVLLEGIAGTRGTVAVGCADRPQDADVFVCGTIQPEGTPAIAIGRSRPGVTSVEATFQGAAAKTVQVGSGLFVIEGPAVPAGEVRGALPISLGAIDSEGNRLPTESAALGGRR
jgi:hypothetical protein